MHHATWLAAFPLAVALPLHHGITSTPSEACALEASAAGEVEQLLPSASIVLLRAASLRSILDPLARHCPDAGEDTASLLARTVGARPELFAEGLAHFDESRAVGLAVWLDAARAPQLTLALPAIDSAALAQVLTARYPRLRTRISSGYLALDSAEPAALGASALSGSHSDRDLELIVDVAGLRTAFGPLIDLALDQAELQLDARASEDGAAGVALEQFDDWRMLFRTAERFEGYLDSSGDRLEARGRLSLADSSWTQAQFGLARTAVLDLARCLDPQAALSVAQSGERSEQARRSLELLASVEEALDDRWTPIVALLREHWGVLADQSGDGSVLNVALGVDGVFASLYLRSAAPEALCERIESALGSAPWRELGVSFSGPHESLSGASTWREYTARLDVHALARQLALQDGQDPGRVAELQSAVDGVLGQEGLRLALTAADGFAVVRVGGSAAQVLESLARLRRPQPSLPGALADAFASSNDACAATIAHFDLGAFLAQVELFAAGLGHSLELPAALSAERFPVTFFASASPLELNGGVTLDAGQLARFVEALRERR